MKVQILILLVFLVSLSGCQAVQTIKKELQASSKQLDVSTRNANIITARLIIKPETVTAQDKATLLKYLKSIRKATIGLNVLVGNYTFGEAVKILYLEGVVTKEEVTGFFSLGRLTEEELNIILRRVTQ